MKIDIKELANRMEQQGSEQKKGNLKGDNWFAQAVEEAEAEAAAERPMQAVEAVADIETDEVIETKADEDMPEAAESLRDPNEDVAGSASDLELAESPGATDAEAECTLAEEQSLVQEQEQVQPDPAEKSETQKDGEPSEASAEPETPELQESDVTEAEAEESADALEETADAAEIVDEETEQTAAGEQPAAEAVEAAPEEQSSETAPEEVQAVKSFWRLYGSMFGIAAAFVLLLAGLVVYTAFTPRTIYATIDGTQQKISTKAYTVEKFLNSQGIGYCEADYISIPLQAYVHDGMELNIEHALDFTVTADGTVQQLKSLKGTVGEALSEHNITVEEKDIVKPGVKTALAQDMEIIIQRVVVKRETREETVKFKTKEQNDSSMDQGKTKVITKGKNGKDKVTYEVTYTDGKETAKKEIKRETIEKPVDKVVAKGTRFVFNGSSYSRKLTVKAYSYTGGGRTAMGTRARVGEIAVDPSVIPLGSEVYIEGVGARRAEDTGGNIKGNTIDIYMNSTAECRNWGVRYVTIYIK